MEKPFFIRDQEGRYLEYDDCDEGYAWWFDKDFATEFHTVGDAHIFIIEHNLDDCEVTQ